MKMSTDANSGVKMQLRLLFLFLLPFVMYLSGFDLFNVSYFS